jgi:hypothetical protein
LGVDPGIERRDIEMRAVRIKVEPFDFISYLELECTKALNRHGSIKITGIIRQEDYKKYMALASQETWIRVNAISESDTMRYFFAGVLTGLWMEKEGQVYVLTIEAKTGSSLLDIMQHTRSFQTGGTHYAEVIDICMEASAGQCVMLEKSNAATKHFILQYQETDWEFLLRLASYAGTVLIPEDRTEGKKLYWGYKQFEASDEVQTDCYQIVQDYGWRKRREAAGLGEPSLEDAISYVVESREIYDLGEIIVFNGIKMVVGEIESWLKGQELYHKYHFMKKKRGVCLPIYNQSISGISLKANVLDVEKTVVKIQIEEDENKDRCKSCWLDYATVYSTPDGTGWYCMPEPGDEVRMVIPDQHEEHAYVAGSVHLGAAGVRTDPDVKSWKNRQNKEVLFTKDSIIFRNNKGMSLELSDQEGIKIISDKDIIVQSDGDIQMKSQGASVGLTAAESVLMQQGSAKIQIRDDINISGGKIYMN